MRVLAQNWNHVHKPQESHVHGVDQQVRNFRNIFTTKRNKNSNHTQAADHLPGRRSRRLSAQRRQALAALPAARLVMAALPQDAEQGVFVSPMTFRTTAACSRVFCGFPVTNDDGVYQNAVFGRIATTAGDRGFSVNGASASILVDHNEDEQRNTAMLLVGENREWIRSQPLSPFTGVAVTLHKWYGVTESGHVMAGDTIVGAASIFRVSADLAAHKPWLVASPEQVLLVSPVIGGCNLYIIEDMQTRLVFNGPRIQSAGWDDTAKAWVLACAPRKDGGDSCTLIIVSSAGDVRWTVFAEPVECIRPDGLVQTGTGSYSAV